MNRHARCFHTFQFCAAGKCIRSNIRILIQHKISADLGSLERSRIDSPEIRARCPVDAVGTMVSEGFRKRAAENLNRCIRQLQRIRQNQTGTECQPHAGLFIGSVKNTGIFSDRRHIVACYVRILRKAERRIRIAFGICRHIEIRGSIRIDNLRAVSLCRRTLHGIECGKTDRCTAVQRLVSDRNRIGAPA